MVETHQTVPSLQIDVAVVSDGCGSRWAMGVVTWWMFTASFSLFHFHINTFWSGVHWPVTLSKYHSCIPHTLAPTGGFSELLNRHCDLLYIINKVFWAMNADWLTAVVYQTIYHGYDKTFICTALITLVTSLYSNKAPWWFVVYCQYTTAKGCIQALRVASCVKTDCNRGILSIYHTPLGLIA